MAMTFELVDDIPCPSCGAYWGNPDPALDFPNRPKIDSSWKCYNPDCAIDYYNSTEDYVEWFDPYELKDYTGPFSMVEKDGLWLNEDEQEIKKNYLLEEGKRIAKKVSDDIDKHGLKVFEHRADGTVVDMSIPPGRKNAGSQ